MIPTFLDHKIRAPLKALPPGAGVALAEALAIPNLAKEQAKKQQVWGWQQMPDTIDMYHIEDDMIVMPRGFLRNYLDGMALMGQEVEIVDQRCKPSLFRIGNRFELREHQKPAVEAILEHGDGIYKAPAGSGKTVTILAAIRRAATPSIVIVNTKDIVWQWMKRAEEFLGPDYPVGQIGDGVFEVSPYLTVATAQTLHSRFDQLESEGFFDQFGFMCIDECHHATAETYNRIIDRFSARYRIGVSATPDKTGDFALATNVLGPVFHETKPKVLQGQGILIMPEVRKVVTKFGFSFRGTTSRWSRSNYPQMVESLIRDRDRNELIVERVLREAGHHQLVISKRLEHLDLLEAMIADAGHPDPLLRLTGQEKSAEREHVVELAASGPCVLLSTLADEALDVPRLDRLHLVFPQKNTGLVTQQVGRVERVHPDKEDAIIYDYADMNVGPFEKQWRGRRFEVYEIRGYKITTEKAVKA